MTDQTLIPVASIAATILEIRRCKVILDRDLARLYGVETKRLNEQIRRNAERFPADFLFQLTNEEYGEVLRSQNATLEGGRGKHRKYLPYAFTEHGAVMAATVLNSPKAIEVSVYVVRAFIEQRAMLAAHADMAVKLERIERKLLAGLHLLETHDDMLTDHESQLEYIIQTLRQVQQQRTHRSIGFRPGDGEEE